MQSTRSSSAKGGVRTKKDPQGVRSWQSDPTSSPGRAADSRQAQVGKEKTRGEEAGMASANPSFKMLSSEWEHRRPEVALGMWNHVRGGCAWSVLF